MISKNTRWPRRSTRQRLRCRRKSPSQAQGVVRPIQRAFDRSYETEVGTADGEATPAEQPPAMEPRERSSQKWARPVQPQASPAHVHSSPQAADNHEIRLTEAERAIIKKLGDSSIPSKGAGRLRRCRRENGQGSIAAIERAGIVERPRGKKKGYLLTQKGREIYRRLFGSAAA